MLESLGGFTAMRSTRQNSGTKTPTYVETDGKRQGKSVDNHGETDSLQIGAIQDLNAAEEANDPSSTTPSYKINQKAKGRARPESP
ncbi:MAG: hypothetical protein Q9180_009348 [Flavoplaca navasiana]